MMTTIEMSGAVITTLDEKPIELLKLHDVNVGDVWQFLNRVQHLITKISNPPEQGIRCWAKILRDDTLDNVESPILLNYEPATERDRYTAWHRVSSASSPVPTVPTTVPTTVEIKQHEVRVGQIWEYQAKDHYQITRYVITRIGPIDFSDCVYFGKYVESHTGVSPDTAQEQPLLLNRNTNLHQSYAGWSLVSDVTAPPSSPIKLRKFCKTCFTIGLR